VNRILAALALALTVLVAPSPAHAAPPSANTGRSGWTPRPEIYPATVTRTDLAIPMSDGVVLRGDLVLPAGADGRAVRGRFPVIVTITAYNKTARSSGGGLAGAPPAYLVKRGYAQLTVDARGTGSSEGEWSAFGARENKDSAEVVAWAHSRKRPWSDGRVGMSGPSYMGINQILAAARHPAGLKAIFRQVPAGDVYRDVVASGGQIDVGFIPLWMGLVTGAGTVPPAVTQSDPQSGFGALLSHLFAAGSFTVPLLLDATLGGDAAYDGPFYRERSPIEVVDRVEVPTFLVSGEYDLFQRGTPLLFESLRARGVPTRLVVGPWDHLQASSGEGLEDAGYGGLPCFSDNAANDRTGVVFETAPLTDPLRLQGPINARLYTSSLSGDGMLSVSVSDVAPDGTVARLSGGWQVISQRALDRSRTRHLDGRVIQPYHPFTRASKQPLASGQVAPVDVEVFPTAARIAPGHRLRIAIQAFDVPHLLPTAPDLPGTLTVLTLHSSERYPSELRIPGVG
jgi:predicted acyl esterase